MGVLIAAAIQSGCKSDVPCGNDMQPGAGSYSYNTYSPVWTPKSEIRAKIKLEKPRPIRQQGKLLVRGNTVFFAEPYEGIHIIDNSNSSLPVKTGFLVVPGVIDIISKENALYADSYSDLVVFDISDLRRVEKRAVLTNVFTLVSKPIPEGGRQSLRVKVQPIADGVITDWKFEGEESYSYTHNGYCPNDEYLATPVTATASQTAKVGSMSRFALREDFIYLLNTPQLSVADVRSAFSPLVTRTGALVWDGETLFPYGGRLFVGGRQGMTVFDLQNPVEPSFVSSFTHARSCDPVVVEDNLAYLTLRAGNGCRQGINQLDIIDLSTITAPRLIRSYPMSEPKGLAIHKPYLYVCDGDKGLSRLNVTDPANVVQAGGTAAFKAFDVISAGNLIVSGSGGLYQFSRDTLQQVSKLE